MIKHSTFSKNLFLIPLTLLFLVPIPISQGCGPYDYSFYGYSFINPQIINLGSKYAAYFAGFDGIFRQLQSKTNIQEKDNLQEWQERFCDIPNTKDLYDLIYKAPIQQIRVLQTILDKKDTPLPPFLAQNSFAIHLKSNQCKEAVDYLYFAKKCEPHVVASSDGWTIPARDTIAMEYLINDGLKSFKNTKSHYFRLRYAYQVIRLAHYKKNYEQVLDLYDYLIPKTDNAPSLIEDWIEGHRAGALMSVGRNVEAAYIYAKVFQNCPSKRTTAYQSFRIKTDEEWIACLKLCQNNQERATLYALRASNPNSLATPEMEEIYLLDPQNENLELLLVREIRRLEKDLLGVDFNKKKQQNKQNHNIPRKTAGQEVVDLQTLVRGITREGKVKNLDLWRIADGYLELLAGDYYAAQKTLKRVQQTVTDEVLKEQLDALLMVATIDGFQKADEEMEQTVALYKKSPLYTKYPDFENFTKDKLSRLYQKEGLEGKAFLYKYSLQELKYNPQLEVIDELLAICKKEDRTKLENTLVIKEDGTSIENDLWDMKGNHFLSQYQLEGALEAYRQIPRKERDAYSLTNPFREVFDDCVNCRIIDTAAFNKVDILEQLIEMEYKAKADAEKGAGYYYQIGIVLYNISYFGHTWQVADAFRSGSSWNYLQSGKEVFPTAATEVGNRETLNCALPLYYFDKAYRLAHSPELAARAAFMAAKCEQNIFYTTKGSRYNTKGNFIPQVTDDYRKYFAILIENYSETEFFKEEVQECLYFERYAARY